MGYMSSDQTTHALGWAAVRLIIAMSLNGLRVAWPGYAMPQNGPALRATRLFVACQELFDRGIEGMGLFRGNEMIAFDNGER